MARLGDLFPDDLAGQAKVAEGGAPALTPLVPLGKAATPRPKAPSVNMAKKTERSNIAELAAGQEFDQIFLVGEATLRVAKNGSKYIQASFGDKSGSVPVRQWDATDADLGAYKGSGFVKARGRVEVYQNATQLIVFSVQELDAGAVNPSDFMPVSIRPLDEMEREFEAVLETLKDADYKRLIKSIFSDAEVKQKFVRGPAATNVHHAWIGGLIEHVLSAVKTAEAIAAQRPFLNRSRNSTRAPVFLTPTRGSSAATSSSARCWWNGTW
jgi:3'-5' exoribonuclease